jgi:putative SOS response-associated peptidase YedK
MPVLLTANEEFDTWLNGSPREAFSLARSLDAGGMRIVQSGSEREDLLAG